MRASCAVKESVALPSVDHSLMLEYDDVGLTAKAQVLSVHVALASRLVDDFWDAWLSSRTAATSDHRFSSHCRLARVVAVASSESKRVTVAGHSV